MTEEEFREKVEALVNMVGEHERTLYGHPETHRRDFEPGIVAMVDEIAKAFRDVRAVARAMWALVGVGAFSLFVSMVAIYLSFNPAVIP